MAGPAAAVAAGIADAAGRAALGIVAAAVRIAGEHHTGEGIVVLVCRSLQAVSALASQNQMADVDPGAL